MLEGALIKAINRRLPKRLHSQSMTSGSQTHNGIPDRYYDGSLGDLWVEYKQRDAMPRNGFVGGVDAKKRGCYSPLQYEWMKRRYDHCMAAVCVPNVIGIIGLPNRTAVVQLHPGEWLHGTTIAVARSFDEVAAVILAYVGPPLEPV